MKLGELLLAAKLISEAQLNAALEEQRKWGGKLGEILVRMTFLSEEILVKALSKQLNIPRVDLESLPAPEKQILGRIAIDLARDLRVIAVQLRDEKTLVVAMADPNNLTHIDELAKVTRCRIVPVIAEPTQIAKSIARWYGDLADDGLDNDGAEPFKVVDSQGNTVVKSIAEVEASGRAPTVGPAPIPPPVGAQPEAPGARRASNVAEVLNRLEQAQRREVAVLKSLVELMFERGLISREDYIAKLRSNSG